MINQIIKVLFVIMLAYGSTCVAQAAPFLDLGSATGTPGSSVSIPITLTNATGVAIAAVGMDIGYDVSQLENPTASIGLASSAAGKMISSISPSSGVFRVAAFGFNSLPIGDGVVIDVKFTIKPAASAGDVALSNTPDASDTNSDSIALSLTGTNGKVSVTRSNNSVTYGLTLTITGNGTVNSDPSGFACGGDVCSARYSSGSELTLIATPSGTDSIVSNWSGDCAGSNGCHIIFDGNKAVTVNFVSAVKAKIGSRGYPSLQAAYDNSVTTDHAVIQLLEGGLTGTFTADKNNNVTIAGGYTSDFSAVNSETTIGGPVNIKTGAVVMSGIVVR